jgi:3-dehydroquinate dehydratase-1
MESYSDDDCDVLELRLDALGIEGEALSFCQRHQGRLPLLLTARDPAQGGLGSLSHAKREDHLQKLLQFAEAIDVEFLNFQSFAQLRDLAIQNGCAIVASHHDFLGFDPVEIHDVLSEAQAAGATIAKAAVTLGSANDLFKFEALAAEFAGTPFSLMGMGPYAQVSRLLAAQHGSLLNYGYLGKEATAPGQWPAALLKKAIAATPRL